MEIRVGLPWPSLLGFLRLVTNPRVFQRPEPMGMAWRQMQAWLGTDPAWIPQPTERHAAVARAAEAGGQRSVHVDGVSHAIARPAAMLYLNGYLRRPPPLGRLRVAPPLER